MRPGYELPLVGQVAAGEPILAEENIDEYLEIPDVIGGEDGDYILQIRGESMKNAGILEGDYVVVRPCDDADNGEIVVALIGEEATVKRIYREPEHIRLQPENDEMEPILSTEARVLGRVVGVFPQGLSARGRIPQAERKPSKAVDAGRAAMRAQWNCVSEAHDRGRRIAPVCSRPIEDYHPHCGPSGPRGGRKPFEESPDTTGQGGG